MRRGTKPWERAGKALRNRSLRRYLIVAEDAKSGLDYLRSFQIPDNYAHIVAVGGAGNTVSVVEKALELREKAAHARQPFVHTWCVIDRDEHPLERYRLAFARAKMYRDVTVIWANECFELWYLLHFCYRVTAIGRAELRKELSRSDRLNRKYDKADAEIFELLRGKRRNAHRNAERLLASNPSPEINPSTNIQVLVGQLEALQTAAGEI